MQFNDRFSSDRKVPSERTFISVHRVGAFLLGMTLLLAGCSSPLKPSAFKDTTPQFDPITFWSRPTSSWGVIENLDGAPTSIIRTTTDSVTEGSSGLHMIQHVLHDGDDTVRDWYIHRLGDHRFSATASDVVGTASGSTSGRTLHWTWTLAAKPGNSLYNVTMNQWMYLADDGTLLVRSVVSKLGIRLAEISEQFVAAKGDVRSPASARSTEIR